MSKTHKTTPPAEDDTTAPADSSEVDLAEGADCQQATKDEPSSNSVESLQADLADVKNQLLRSQAELENYRKRVQRDMDQQRRYAVSPLVIDLLTVVDNIERAIDAAEKNDGTEGLLEGIKMVAAQLTGVLKQHHCTRVESVGMAFDPNVHEALGHQPGEEFPANVVSMETRSGYHLHARVIRPAQVFISSGTANETMERDATSEQATTPD